LYMPIQVTYYHECYPYSLAAATPLTITYIDGVATSQVSISTGYTITPSLASTLSYCFTSTLSLTHPTLTPAITTIALTLSGNMINVPQTSYPSFTPGNGLITQYGQLSMKSILDGSVTVTQDLTVNHKHRCYDATITASPAGY
jgi:hypothetical protein